MKRILLLLTLITLCGTLQAQKVKLGYQNSFMLHGVNTKNYPIYDSLKFYQAAAGSLMPSYRTGLTLQWPVIKNLGLETGVLVDLMGYRFSQNPVASIGGFHGNVLSLGLRVPLLAYYKLVMGNGGAFILGGGFSMTYAFSGVYRYRIDGRLENYKAITDFSRNVNQFMGGYQLVFGIEDSEYSQFRISYGASQDSYTLTGPNKNTPFFIAFTIIGAIN